MTEAEAALLEAAENLALSVGAGFDTDHTMHMLYAVCKEFYPDSIIAKGLPLDEARVRRLKVKLTDVVLYERLYT